VAHVDDGRPRSISTSTSNGVVITIDEPADDTTYTRRGLSLTFGATRGDSGAPVVNRAGAVVGMVFATARADAHLSFAVGPTDQHVPWSRRPSAFPGSPLHQHSDRPPSLEIRRTHQRHGSRLPYQPTSHRVSGRHHVRRNCRTIAGPTGPGR